MALPKDSSFFWTLLWLLAYCLRLIFCRLRVEGVDHVPRTGGCILSCNHSMGPDYIVLGFVSPRQVIYMVKGEAFEINRFVTWVLVNAGTFPVQRGQRDRAAIDAAVAQAKSGRVLGMFPEGTRSRTGALQPGKTGVARIAMAAGVPVVPVVVINSPAIYTRFQQWQRPLVTVRFGEPLYPGDAWNGETGVRAKAFTNQIMQAMAALMPPELRGAYAAEPPAQEPLSSDSGT
jgi:1-acyl-sn-glycerol-3-phosphate acyltransferase